MLIPNSTDKCQPLDVAFFGPQKKAWRQILDEHKMKHPTSTGLNKAKFPALLKTLIDKMELSNKDNLKAGFKACGIYPLDAQKVLNKLPAETLEDAHSSTGASSTCQSPRKRFISPALLEYLQQFRYNPDQKRDEATVVKKKRLSLEPGKSISEEDLLELERQKKATKKTASVRPRSKKAKQPKSSTTVPATPKPQSPVPATGTAKPPTTVPGTSKPATIVPASVEPPTPGPSISEPPVPVSAATCTTEIGDFVIVQVPCQGKEKHKFYVTKVLSSNADGMVDVKYLKQSGKAANKFSFPTIVETEEVDIEDIVLKLPKPDEGILNKTKRQASLLSFGLIDLSHCE